MTDKKAVLIKPKLLFFKSLGGFLNQNEAEKRATELEKELIDFMRFSQLTMEVDVDDQLHFRTKEGCTNSHNI